MRGRLFVLSGPAGVGKGTVIAEVFKQIDGIVYSVSCTTRAPRPGEVDGRNYYFMSEKEFNDMIAAGQFLEWARVHGNCYGTRRDSVEKHLERGVDVLLEIDVQGAMQVKEKMPEAVMVFIQPPSFDELVGRLKARGTETPEQLEIRIANAEKELAAADKYEYRITNDIISEAVRDFVEIIQKYRRNPA